MKKQILYGVSNEDKRIPWYEGFEVHADGSMDIRLSGINFFEIEEELLPITWRDIFNSKLHELCNRTEIYHQNLIEDHYYDPFTIFDEYIDRLWAMLRNYCNPKSDAERAFFDLYCELCFHNEDHYSFLPALIPNVYINWYSCKEQRRINEKPYIVDFVFKSPKFGTNNLVIVEIDGRSHYANFDKGSYVLSEDKYAEHLIKDRLLRKQVFKVFRIGNSEINYIKKLPEKDKIKEFYFFFQEIFGDIIFIEGYHDFSDMY